MINNGGEPEIRKAVRVILGVLVFVGFLLTAHLYVINNTKPSLGIYPKQDYPLPKFSADVNLQVVQRVSDLQNVKTVSLDQLIFDATNSQNRQVIGILTWRQDGIRAEDFVLMDLYVFGVNQVSYFRHELGKIPKPNALGKYELLGENAYNRYHLSGDNTIEIIFQYNDLSGGIYFLAFVVAIAVVFALFIID